MKLLYSITIAFMICFYSAYSQEVMSNKKQQVANANSTVENKEKANKEIKDTNNISNKKNTIHSDRKDALPNRKTKSNREVLSNKKSVVKE
ncbi:MAG: hypothetical protein NZ516_12790 [Raineya sp.]|nr:hypothetical protein [Raineya sp.]